MSFAEVWTTNAPQGIGLLVQTLVVEVILESVSLSDGLIDTLEYAHSRTMK